jgi:hypothetical protein
VVDEPVRTPVLGKLLVVERHDVDMAGISAHAAAAGETRGCTPTLSWDAACCLKPLRPRAPVC